MPRLSSREEANEGGRKNKGCALHRSDDKGEDGYPALAIVGSRRVTGDELPPGATSTPGANQATTPGRFAIFTFFSYSDCGRERE